MEHPALDYITSNIKQKHDLGDFLLRMQSTFLGRYCTSGSEEYSELWPKVRALTLFVIAKLNDLTPADRVLLDPLLTEVNELIANINDKCRKTESET